MTLDTILVVLSNIALVIVTGLLIFVSLREANRHNEHEDADLVHVIDKVIDEHDRRHPTATDH